MRLTILLPIALCIAAFVLSLLSLLAGRQPGFMEDYHIILFNTSTLGEVLVPTPTSGGSSPTTTSGGIGGWIGGVWSSATAAVAGAIESELASIEDHIADDLAHAIGIEQFYSIHVLDMCEGYYSPNATAPGAGYNVTNCTQPLDTSYTNISAKLDHELQVGPFKLNLADLNWTQDLQHELDKIPGLLNALGALFIVSTALCGLALLLSLVGLLTAHRHPRLIPLANVGAAALAALVLLVADLVVTIGAGAVVDFVNSNANNIGLYGQRGSKFIAISWAAFACMFVAAAAWTYEFIIGFRARRRERAFSGNGRRHVKEVRHSDESYHAGRGGGSSRGWRKSLS